MLFKFFENMNEHRKLLKLEAAICVCIVYYTNMLNLLKNDTERF